MAKLNGKWKKRLVFGLSLTLATTLSLGVLSACKKEESAQEEEPVEAAMPADMQTIKNGNFKFYSEMTKEDKDEFRTVLNTPTNWSFTSGSPSSDTKSGLVDLTYWDYFTASSHAFTSIDDAVANWKEGSVYDRLKFYEDFRDGIKELKDDSAAKKLFDEYSYSVDYEDLQYLREELGAEVKLHSDEVADKGVLMIHNRRTSDNVLGTAQYYTASNAVTLSAGTAAKISVWVKTSHLQHWYSDSEKKDVENVGGAYIGVTQTVGGTTLDQMQIKNINTKATTANNGWEQYTVYVRANTYAATTFKLVLGLGQGSSDNRYEAVNGYALFDDITCDILSESAYDKAGIPSDNECGLESKDDAKKFNATLGNVYGIDLDAEFTPVSIQSNYTSSFGLTEEKAGPSKIYTSKKIDAALYDNRTDSEVDENARNIAEITNRTNILASTNGYMVNIAKDAFGKDKTDYTYKFDNDDDIIFLLSGNGAAYTATVSNISVPDEQTIAISFFVKTSKVLSGKTGATITLIDGENKTSISAFDSTAVAAVSIGKEGETGYVADINDGWVPCFFFVTNNEKEEKSFDLQFSLGPTAIVSSSKSQYGQGWAAFTGFQMRQLSKTEASYVSTGDRAKSVTLTGVVSDTTKFDSASAVFDIKDGLALPASFKGVRAASKALVSGSEIEDKIPDGVYAGLLNAEHADAYLGGSESWNTYLAGKVTSPHTGNAAWADIFSDGATVARQPLIIVNTAGEQKDSYGYMTKGLSVSPNTYQEISMRVMLSEGATATIYLIDTEELSAGNANTLSPNAPKVTFWYDDNGNICKSDPSQKGFKAQTGTLYTLQPNGLYRDANNANDSKYYANLYNYEVKDGNYVTKDGTIAFYTKDGKVYANYNEEKDEYSTEVTAIPDTALAYARYNYSSTQMLTSQITVKGTAATAGKWIDVSFYVHTGSETKNYRLEVWAGSRNNKDEAGNPIGIPANGYVFFDHYTSASTSNYDALVKEAVSNLKSEKGYTADENGNLVAKTATGEDLPVVARYYTYTFYDSVSYMRYDATTDKDNFNPYGEYKQSEYSEQLISLAYESDSEHTYFIDYAATDVSVTAAEKPTEEENTDDEETDKKKVSVGDILMIVSSALLAVVLLAVIVVMLVRRFMGSHKKTAKIKPVKDKRYKPSKSDETPSDEE